MTKSPLRGEVWWMDFDPAIGEEIRKTRPAVVMSNNSANKNTQRVQVVPLTSQTKRLYPGEALVTLKGKHCKAVANQIQTVSKLRIKDKAGQLNDHEIKSVEAAIREQLDL